MKLETLIHSMKELSYKDAPHNWAICFQDDCPLSAQCLRHAIAKLAPPTLTHHVTVLPAARKGDRCTFFATTEPARIARGMTRLLPSEGSERITAIRQGMYGIFGSQTHYYRYRRGEYDITPEQQKRVSRLFKKYGFTGEIQYDDTRMDYYFPKK